MNINKITPNINFGARHVMDMNVGKLNGDKYVQKDVAFVELDPTDKKDRNALKKIAHDWGYYCFAEDIYNEVNLCLKDNPEKGQVFALTTQARNFENLDPDSVLGLAEINTKDKKKLHTVYIERLQTNPEYLDAYEKPQYRGIGTSIHKCLFKEYQGNRITLNAVPLTSVLEHYEKNGYVRRDCSYTFDYDA